MASEARNQKGRLDGGLSRLLSIRPRGFEPLTLGFVVLARYSAVNNFSHLQRPKTAKTSQNDVADVTRRDQKGGHSASPSDNASVEELDHSRRRATTRVSTSTSVMPTMNLVHRIDSLPSACFANTFGCHVAIKSATSMETTMNGLSRMNRTTNGLCNRVLMA